MRRILILAAISAVAVARPEQYREKEDFQYSRSSSDEGSKAGYYGAQRGNMGGNYERAHNMDNLAQHQMSGAVNQVQGELGDAAKTRTGSVYTAANSRGVYGSGKYDLSNLAGRNFQETSLSDSQSQTSAQLSSAYNNPAYQSQSTGYGRQTAGQSGHSWQSADQLAIGNTQSYGHEHSSGYHSQSGFHTHSTDSNSDYNLQAQNQRANGGTRLVSAVPVRIVVRPGGRVAIPVGAQTYDLSQYNGNQGSSNYDANQRSLSYDANQRSSSYDANQRSSSYDANQRSSTYDANQRSSAYGQSIGNSEAEVLSGVNQQNGYRPANDAKFYESSYKYHKEWEKHATVPSSVPSIIPTENPFPQNSELNEDLKGRTSDHQYNALASGSQRVHSSNANSGYSSSSQSRHKSGFNSQQYGSSSSASNSNAYTQGGYNAGLNADLNSQVEDINSKPKSYQSSYSYHKSWERQGDPYVIKPASNAYTDGQSLQYSSGTKGGYRSGSHQAQDCDEICGLSHSRKARSYDASQYEELGQQVQNMEDLGQQSQNLEYFGQQQSQNLEDLGQQQSQNLEDFGQQQSQNLEDFGQQQSQNLEDFGQQSQNTWDNNNLGRLDIGQQNYHNPKLSTQDIWSKLEPKPQSLDQGTTNNWEGNTKEEDLQKNQGFANTFGLPYNTFNQQTQPQIENERKYRQQVGSIWDKLDTDSLQNGNSELQPIREQKTNGDIQVSQNEQKQSDYTWSNFQDTEQTEIYGINSQISTQKAWDQFAYNPQPILDKPTFQNNNNQEFQTSYDHHNWNVDTNSHTQNKWHEQTTSSDSYLNHNLQSQSDDSLLNLWNKLDTIEKDLETSVNKSHDEKYNSSQEYTSPQNSYQTFREDQTGHREGVINTQYSYQSNNSALQSGYHPSVSEYDINKSNSSGDNDKVTSPQTERGDIGREDIDNEDNGRNDIGRGDIGPEDISAQSDEGASYNKRIFPSATGVRQTNKQDNVDQQKSEDKKPSSSSYVPMFISSSQGLEKDTTDVLLQNNEQKIGLIEKEVQSFDQQNVVNLIHKTEGSSLDLSENTQQHFGQQTDNLEHNLQAHGQHNENLDQQNVQDFGHQNENLDQQNLQDFGQQSENLDQQNLQDFGQQSENLDQQNLQDFGQQSENLDQQNLQDFGQQSENLDQQNLQDFGHQNENLDQQNLQDFGQQSENLDQQNLQDFGQQSENLNQQNLQDFGQQSEMLDQQNLQDFGQQSENLDQQNLQDFGQQNENLDQQNLQDFGQKSENLDKQNLQDFGQQSEALEQQDEQVFGQQTIQDSGHSQWLYEGQQLQPFDTQNSEQNTQNLNQQNKEYFPQQSLNKFEHVHSGHEPQQSQELGPRDLEKNEPLDYTQLDLRPHPEKMEVAPIDTQHAPPTPSVETPPEPASSKPGFWKSVGNKFTTAKDKVFSWFGS